ncbi:acyl carrier protein [Aquisalimonas lutea]|uniref:acyl carrier protein n=1 Tax=Aquisalimonas lutea TaxID=1327750 RepID=UPI0025B37F20|nr:acyl carrier protein [Aquisalimonas lutea]MDN3517217.1 acyl carrier protein [Aquisalimonas lutea]
MPTLDEVNTILDESLALEGRARHFEHSTPLLGGVPEFDSMAVVSLVTALEEHFGITVDDEDITAETFETVGSLLAFVQRKCDGQGVDSG